MYVQSFRGLNQSLATPAQGESLMMRHDGKMFTGNLTRNSKDRDQNFGETVIIATECHLLGHRYLWKPSQQQNKNKTNYDIKC